jgi:hypothetical protein
MALERFWALIDRWRDDVAALTDEQLDMVGFSQYPYDGGLFGHRGPSSLSPNTVAVPGLAIANSAVSASICSIAAVSAGRGREGHDDEPFGPRGECPPEHGLFRPAHELAHSRKTVQSQGFLTAEPALQRPPLPRLGDGVFHHDPRWDRRRLLS